MLAIGTFGNNGIKENSKHNDLQEIPSSSQDHQQQLTPEEVGKLQNELNLLLHKQAESTSDTESDAANLVLDKFLHSNPSLEDGKTKCDVCSDDSNNKDCCLQGANSVILSKGKDISVDKTSSAINRKSLSFLLKKMVVCGSGFTPTPSLRDQVPESRMEKVDTCNA